MSSGDEAGTGFSTMRGRNYPSIRQFTVFLENRVGQLLEVIRRFEGSHVRIVALSINDSAECAFVRFLLSHPEEGREILERAGLAIIESDLIGVDLPEGPQPLLKICTALLQAEVNIIQAYPLIIRPHDRAAVALMVDNIDLGLETLASKVVSHDHGSRLAGGVLSHSRNSSGSCLSPQISMRAIEGHGSTTRWWVSPSAFVENANRAESQSPLANRWGTYFRPSVVWSSMAAPSGRSTTRSARNFAISSERLVAAEGWLRSVGQHNGPLPFADALPFPCKLLRGSRFTTESSLETISSGISS